MRDVIETFEKDVNGIHFMVNVVCYGGAQSNFDDQWKAQDEHMGGVTIANPIATSNSWKYFRPLQTSLAELCSQYAAQGRDNPSKEAYESLQRQLVRDIGAGDYGFVYSATVGDELITSGETCAFGFDWSYEDGTELAAEGLELFTEHCEDEAIQNVAETCKRLVEMGDKLRAVSLLLRNTAAA